VRQSLGVRFAILGVVAHHPDGVHGYALKRQCDRILGHFWQLNFPEVYRVLNRLAADRMIEAVDDGPDASRKVYRITERGRESLDAFLLEPPHDLPRPLRQELAVKLLFAGAERLPELVRLINSQRDTYMEQLHLLAVQRRRLQRLPIDPFVANLLIDGAEGSVRAEIAWLDDVCEKLTERFGAPAA
jgi:DNA-binding PadR family transcriptional regulator